MVPLCKVGLHEEHGKRRRCKCYSTTITLPVTVYQISMDADFSLSMRECITVIQEARDEDRHSALTKIYFETVQGTHNTV